MLTYFGTHMACSIPWTAPVACLAWKTRIIAGNATQKHTEFESSLDHDADFQQLVHRNTGNGLRKTPSLMPTYRLGMLSGLWKGEMMVSDTSTPS